MSGAAPHELHARADDVIRSIIRTTADKLITTQSAAIADAPDGVHQHRTHVRRLRSVLAAFRDQLDEPAARDLRVQFREWGQQLGVVRDFEVQAEVAESALEDLGIEDAEMRTRLVDAQRQAHAKAHVRLCKLHEGPRSIARMAALEAFAADPPLTTKADARVHKLAAVAKREARRVRRAAKRANGSIESLHAVRKAGRRLRYVAEALHAAVPDQFGADFEELAEAGEDVHDALGDHRDELIFIERLELARAQAGRAGERVEQYDALIARAADRADESLAGLDAALDRVRAAAAAI